MTVSVDKKALAGCSSFSSKEKARFQDFLAKLVHNPKNPGISLERVRKVGDSLWSGRVTQDLRAILAQDGDDWVVLHVDHHDPAYRWAERRKVGRHAQTGDFQVIDLEAVAQAQAAWTTTEKSEPPLLEHRSTEYLQSLGVSIELVPAVRAARDEAELCDLLSLVPELVAERLIALASGEFVAPPVTVVGSFEQPEHRQRYFVVEDQDELAAALSGDLADWMLFLHPTQRQIVEGVFTGPVIVSGAAGTGKTVVGIHRARELARRGARVLVATYTKTLADDLERGLDRLCGLEPDVRGRIGVSTVHAEASRLGDGRRPLGGGDLHARFSVYTDVACPGSSLRARVEDEWRGVVMPLGLGSWSEYRDVSRRGRSTLMSRVERKEVWDVLGGFLAELAADGKTTFPLSCVGAVTALGESPTAWDAVIIDEVQDLGLAELQLVARLAAARPEHLMLVGDPAQRLYGSEHDLRDVGLIVTAHRFDLRTNYRTTEQILSAAWAVQSPTEPSDLRRWSRSLLRGPAPSGAASQDASSQAERIVSALQHWLTSTGEGTLAVLTRTRAQASALRSAIELAGVPCQGLRGQAAGMVRVGTMHSAKGLEFACVVVASCDATSVPHPQALADCRDLQDLDNAMAHERNLLYVAMTRARDEVLVTWFGPPSPFLEPAGITG